MKLQLNQNKYWDGVTSTKNFGHQINWEFVTPLLQKDAKILDYGCGYGRLTHDIADHGYSNVIGVDSSQGMIQEAREKFPALTFEHNLETTIPFSDNEFDAVFLFTILTCIPFNHDQYTLFQELQRVLKPGGLVYISDVLINTDQRNRRRYESGNFQPYGIFTHSEGTILRHHSIEYLRDELLTDFHILHEEIFTMTTMNGNASNAIQLLGRLE
jgi:ubiquinone/menaquinone biosynthesis C-methylase UbiE